MSDMQEEISNTVDAASAAPKRRPGRPRKKAAEEPELQATAATTKKAATKSTAAKTKAAKTTTAQADEEAPAALKRRPGRPRKSSGESAAEENKVAEASAAEAQATDALEGEATPASPKRQPRQRATQSDKGTDIEQSPDSNNASEQAMSPDAEGANQNGDQNGQGHQSNYSNHTNGNNRNNTRRNKRSRSNEPLEPKANREELAALKLTELRHLATELELDFKLYPKKEDLIEAVYQAQLVAEGFASVEGVLDILPEGYGFLRTTGYLPGEKDAYVHSSLIRRNGLRKGDLVAGQLKPIRDNEKFAAVNRIDTVNGRTLEEIRHRVKFADLTPVYPDQRLVMEHTPQAITARVIDLVAPIGKGQRGLIVSPPKAGKTTILKDIAAAITANNPEIHLMCLLVDERPEEVTDMQRSIRGEVIASTFDMPCENHIAVSEMVIERAKRLVEVGEDVVILLDSITRLARAYNLAQPASGRILSGGVDSTALYPPKRFLGAARNIENGGSLTILASALIDTGSKMDEVIFEEFKGTGNMELKLDRTLADRRIFPAIDPVTSGTRKEELLMDQQEAPFVWGVRRILANLNNTERAMEMLIKSLKQTNTNQEFLIRTARKAQEKNGTSLDVS